MNEQLLSKRLERVGANVPIHARLADIGSDHAYLPVALMLKDKIDFAVAGEVVKGPFESALNQVQKNGLEEKIIVRLADGLAAIKEEDSINTITIAGMGGTLIASILEAGKAQKNIKGTERFVLQPNVGERNVREWLVANHYQITHEEILEENGKIYEIIVADPSGNKANYTEQELRFGPFLMIEKSSIFMKKWQNELDQKFRVIEQLEKATIVPEPKIAHITNDINLIKGLFE